MQTKYTSDANEYGATGHDGNVLNCSWWYCITVSSKTGTFHPTGKLLKQEVPESDYEGPPCQSKQ